MPLQRNKLNKQTSYLEDAISIVGNTTIFAKRIGLTYQAIKAWILTDKPSPPAKYCQVIEDMTFGKVTKAQLRPDLFDKEPPKELSCSEKIEKGMLLLQDALKELNKGKKGAK